MQWKLPIPPGRTPSLMKVAGRVSLAVIALILLCLIVFIFYPDPILNRYVLPMLTEAYADAYPASSLRIVGMTYRVLGNRFRFSSVTVKTVDSMTAIRFGSVSVSGVGWAHLLWGGSLTRDDFAHAGVEAKDIRMVDEGSGYEFRSERVILSVADSEVVVNALKLHPQGNDAAFFAARDVRQTMVRLNIPLITVEGVAILEALEGTAYQARSVDISGLAMNIQVNTDKPVHKDAPSPDMPHQMIASLGTLLEVGRVSITNGRATYTESSSPDLEPARISFDSIRVTGTHVSSRGQEGHESVIRAEALLAETGPLTVVIRIPLASPELSFHYSGSLGSMELSALNTFLQPVEQMRITSGTLQEATFNVDVTSGVAVGSIRGVYRGLVVAAVDKYSGSDKGLADKITSYIARTFTIHGTNVPDSSGRFRIGEVRYKRKQDDTFIQYVWYSLRTGVQDVVGF